MKRRWPVIGGVGSLLVLLTCLAYGFLIEPARLVMHQETLDLPRWPASLSGLRVALVGDLHVGSPHWGLDRVRALVEAVDAEGPDLVLLAGDYRIHDVAFGRYVPEIDVARALGGLRAPLGVFAVMGNHDPWHDETVRAAFRASGIRVLEDEVAEIPARGASFDLLGVEDEEARTRTGAEELARVPPGAPLLVLSHEPDLFPELDDRPALVLAAHTHGGQVRLPWIGPPIPHSRYGQRYVAGHVVENGRHLFVTTGVGTSILPIRLGVPPEIVVLTLRASP